MNPILLAISLTVNTNDTVKVDFTPPARGTYYVMEAQDPCRMVVVRSGPVTDKEHVSVTLKKREVGFVRVEFQPRSIK